MADQLHEMVTFNTERIETAYLTAVANGIIEPVVIVVDPRDRMGRDIAVSLSGKTDVDKTVADCEARGVRACAIVTYPKTDAIALLSPISPKALRSINTANYPTQFAVVAVGDGRVAYATKTAPE